MQKIYRISQYFFRVMTAFGFYMGLCHASISDGLMEATEQIAFLIWALAIACMIMGFIGARYCKILERDYIREQRAEERRALKSAQELELQKGA